MIAGGFSRYDQIRFTPPRIDGLLMGGLVAIAWRRYAWPKAQKVAFYCAAISALAFFVILLECRSLENHFAELILPSLSAIFFASSVALSLTRRSVLQSPVLGHIAKYSYAMYLWHLLPYMFGQRVLAFAEASSPLAAMFVKALFIPALFALTYLLARVSWATVEEPFLRLKDRV
jgi:peptidoglycan/LPS O-acetylase OafA/YrhL